MPPNPPEMAGLIAVACDTDLLVSRVELSVGEAMDRGFVPPDSDEWDRCMGPGDIRDMPLRCLKPAELVAVSELFLNDEKVSGFGQPTLPSWDESLCIQWAVLGGRGATPYSRSPPNLSWEADGVPIGGFAGNAQSVDTSCPAGELCHVFGNVSELVYSSSAGYGVAGGSYLTGIEVHESLAPTIRPVNYEELSKEGMIRSGYIGLRLLRREQDRRASEVR